MKEATQEGHQRRHSEECGLWTGTQRCGSAHTWPGAKAVTSEQSWLCTRAVSGFSLPWIVTKAESPLQNLREVINTQRCLLVSQCFICPI